MNIILIGFMGVGKSEVGKLLSKRLGYSFIDTDELIERTEKRKIADIFASEGEERFRELETGVIKTLLDYDKFVIATGGGIVLREENVALLKNVGPLVLLHARPEVIFERVERMRNRPLLEGGDKMAKIIEILLKRDPFYNKAADAKIDTSDMSVGDAAEEIIRHVKNKS